jgi:hypothetical protein
MTFSHYMDPLHLAAGVRRSGHLLQPRSDEVAIERLPGEGPAIGLLLIAHRVLVQRLQPERPGGEPIEQPGEVIPK